jgi:hypothetical protein
MQDGSRNFRDRNDLNRGGRRGGGHNGRGRH